MRLEEGGDERVIYGLQQAHLAPQAVRIIAIDRRFPDNFDRNNDTSRVVQRLVNTGKAALPDAAKRLVGPAVHFDALSLDHPRNFLAFNWCANNLPSISLRTFFRC